MINFFFELKNIPFVVVVSFVFVVSFVVVIVVIASRLAADCHPRKIYETNLLPSCKL